MLMWPAAISFPDDYYRRRTAHQIERTLRVITPPDPSILPVELTLARKYLRIEDLDSDDLLRLLLRSAMLRLTYLDIAIVTAKYALDFNSFPYGTDWPYHEIELPLPPLQSVDAIKIVGPDGTTSTVDPSVYTVGLTSWNTGAVRLGYQQSWPDVRWSPGAVSIEFTAGYSTSKDIPENIRLAILMMAHSMYDNRGEVAPINLYPVPKGVDELLRRYQPVGFH